MTGRIVMSSYETLRASGTNVICLSPVSGHVKPPESQYSWGDSSPLFLPCIRFRDLAVHTVIAATGGMAAVAAPVMGPVADVVVTSFGSTILVELGLHAGFELTTKVANDLVFNKTIKKIIPIYSERLETTGVKVLLITLKYKQTMTDAALGFYRSSLHSDTSLFAGVKDYLAVEKGWFSPYLFASARRPIIPRNMKPDIVFCHGPFLSGDYRVGETLLAESGSVIALCEPPAPVEAVPEGNPYKGLSLPSISNMLSRSRTSSPEPALTSLPPPPVPRRMVVLLLGLKPHRKMWTLSARPGESVVNYILLNGCPSIVVPVKVGAPLLAWDGLTLEQLWDVELPESQGSRSTSGKFEGIINIIFEYIDLCVDWQRAKTSNPATEDSQAANSDEAKAKDVLKDAITLLIAGGIRSKTSKEVKKELDPERSGIAMWRIP